MVETSDYALPAGFTDLEDLVPGWARRTERERRHLCAAKDMGDISDYYRRVGPRIIAMATHLDQFPMDTLALAEANLLMLAKMHMEVAVAVEFLHAPDMGPMQITQERWHIHTV